MQGLDLLGAELFHEHLGVSLQTMKRAESSGQRAIAAAKRIQKRAPKLAAAVTKAGQRALSGPKIAAKIEKKAMKAAAKALANRQPVAIVRDVQPVLVQPVMMRAPMPPRQMTRGMIAPRQMTTAVRPAPEPQMVVRPQTTPASSTVSRATVQPRTMARAAAPRVSSAPRSAPVSVLGDDLYTTEEKANARAQQDADWNADIWSWLADAATQVADLMYEFQIPLEQLPQDLPLSQQLYTAIMQLDAVFAAPIEKATAGEGSEEDVKGVRDNLNLVLSQRNDSPPIGIWKLLKQVQQYLSTHTMPVSIAPAEASTPPGSPVQFVMQYVDAQGQPKTPASAPQWSVYPAEGAVIDANGLFTASKTGDYDVSVTVDGYVAHAPVVVDAAATPVDNTATTTSSTPTTGVAEVVVSPIEITVARGLSQKFSAQPLGADGKPITAKGAPSWTVSPAGATIDQTGGFVSQKGGEFTITATVDGVQGTAKAIVQSSEGAPAGGGGGGGGGGGTTDDGFGSGFDAYGAEQEAEQPAPEEGGYYTEEQSQEGADPFADSPFPLLASLAARRSDNDFSEEENEGEGEFEGETDYFAENERGGEEEGDDPFANEDFTAQMFDASYVGRGEVGGGHGGGGHGGHGGHGGGHHGHGHHGGRRGGGYLGPVYYGPWYADGLELLDAPEVTEEDFDELARIVARKLRKERAIIGSFIGGYDIQQTQRQMDSLKQVTVAISRALVKNGLRVVSETIALAKGGMLQRSLPAAAALEKVKGHLDWHANELNKLGDPTAMYASGNDLKKWVVQAFIEANAVEEGRGRQEQIWNEMWTEVGQELAKLPAKITQAIAKLPGQAFEAVTGVPMWVFYIGGGLALCLLGVGVWKLVTLATPAVATVAARRYLP